MVFGSSASGNALVIVAFLKSYRYRSTKIGDLVFLGSCFLMIDVCVMCVLLCVLLNLVYVPIGDN